MFGSAVDGPGLGSLADGAVPTMFGSAVDGPGLGSSADGAEADPVGS